MKEVYVAIVHPMGLGSYVYGVFDTEDQAYEHFLKHGDKVDTVFKVSKEHYIQRDSK